MGGKVHAQQFHEEKFNLIRLVKLDAVAGKNPVFQAEINQMDIDKLSQPLKAFQWKG